MLPAWLKDTKGVTCMAGGYCGHCGGKPKSDTVDTVGVSQKVIFDDEGRRGGPDHP